ncbi:YggS family pyridoxal phosphate-dependent enzyme [Oceanimonas baumannii]|uniref:Pyridoxal phosphate homeostasis protein n=1 Tax=Oceanimonas baumannii TaxID=129578 RepID=A0A235CLT3_9GAMM|nr:YggS family pyridoxal phosphate-dependent enzyme [Oceanimonas baumannii]OYD25512.1 YggS family pyridoxal phosphate-dependent enzyme [Oceanimonas baumannii]TDW61284.1 hypothetical protein LY04_00819 [Oceanimonas baumannii]
MSTIAQHLQNVHIRIDNAAGKAGRASRDIALLAVSKTRPAKDVEAAWVAGQHSFGENYVQEAVDKIIALKTSCPDIVWHLIGPLQSNKTRLVAEHFDWVQTVDRLKIAQRLNDQRSPHMRPLNICLQVNVSGEASKSGISPSEAETLANDVVRLPNLCLRGLMAIPEATDNSEALRAQLLELQHLFDRMQKKHPQMDTLSMGMSNDLELAVACGSTLVRVGTAIFGSRNP